MCNKPNLLVETGPNLPLRKTEETEQIEKKNKWAIEKQ